MIDTLIGELLIGVSTMASTSSMSPPTTNQVVMGTIIIGAVLLDSWNLKRGK